MKQNDREAQQFSLGMKRIEKSEKDANARGYATSGPIVARVAWNCINQYADVIRREFERRSKLTPKFMRQQDHSFLAVVGIYATIKPGPDETIPAPELGYRLLAATIWKTVVDHALTPSGDLIRINVKTDIGNVIELQAEHRHWKQVEQELDAETFQDLKDHIRLINRQLMDTESTKAQRVGRARGLYKEVDSGRVVKRRGKQVGRVLKVPDGIKWIKWQDRCKEQAANELLDLLVVPKGEVPGGDDERPFQLFDNLNGDKADRIVTRDKFVEIMDALKETLGKYVIDQRPLIEPPQDWLEEQMVGTKNFSGGYHTQQIRQLTPMVRFGQGQCETAPSVLTVQLINKVQQTAWRIDNEQFELVKRLMMEWHEDYDGIVRPKPYTLEELQKGTGAAAVEDAVKNRAAWRERANEIQRRRMAGQEIREDELQFLMNWNYNNGTLRKMYREVANSGKRLKALIQMIVRLERERNQTLYYAWNCDSRTRIYPIINVGSPQGAPPERYTLELANGEYLSPSGELAALRAIGAAANDTKGSIQSRIDWSRDNMDLIRFLAEGHDAAVRAASGYEEPLNLLALSRAWVDHENGKPWHKLVYADQTNSGWGIVSALLNAKDGLRATNVCPATIDDAPNDAYTLARDTIVDVLKNKMDELPAGEQSTGDELIQILEVLEDPKMGRTLCKKYACSAIYGSGLLTQANDIQKVLEDNGISSLEMDPSARGKLTRLIQRGFGLALGPVLRYNRGIKAMAKERLFVGVDENVKEEILKMGSDRNKLQSKGKDLGKAEMTRYLELGRLVHEQSEHCLGFTAPDNTFVDLRSYITHSEQYRTAFHGSPTLVLTDETALDVMGMLQATPPAIIHNLDSLTLKCAYADADYELSLIHDSAGCHPNHFDEMTAAFRRGFWYATRPGYLDAIAKQWNVEQKIEIEKDNGWRNNPDSWINMFN